MCGINGFTFSDRRKIKTMNLHLKHRGPDDDGIYIDENISLGNTRLAIIDLSKRGHQPMKDKSGRFIITFNGEIYNFKELKKDLILKNYKFKSNTDTEVILNLYREYGEKAFKKLNGMFAVGLWDKKEKKLVLARDRVGIKPLYYTINNGKLLFSSEIKSLFVHRIKKEIDRQALDIYMRLLYVPAPKTIYKKILKVIPGRMLIWQNGKLQNKSYWKLPQSRKQFNLNKQQTRQEIFELLYDSVKRQMVSDRPVGIFLSGGIDSTVVLALASKIANKPLKTFSIGFKNVAELEKYNADFNLARRSAKFYKSDHHEYYISPNLALETFQKLVKTLDEPISNPTYIPTFILANQARKKVVVALGGDGGDELFGGYRKYLDAWFLDLYQKLPLFLRENFLDYSLSYFKEHKERDFISHFKANKIAEKYLIFMGRSEQQLRSIFTSDYQKTVKTLSQLRGFRFRNSKFYDDLPILDFFHWLPEESLMRTDKMTMQFGLEQRVPFLDNHIIDFAFRIPFSWKIGLRLRKKILREAFFNILPEHVRLAPKRGFFSPGSKWLRNKKWRAYVNKLFSTEKIKNSGVFETKGLQTMLDEHITGKRYNLDLLWAALTFQAWYQHNFKK